MGEQLQDICADYNENNVNGSWTVTDPVTAVLEANNCSAIPALTLPPFDLFTTPPGGFQTTWTHPLTSTTTDRRRLQDSSDSSTTESTSYDLSGQCAEEITAEDKYSTHNYEWTDSELHRYWMYIAIHCVVMRAVSMFLLLFMNNDGFSKTGKFLRRVFCCQCKEDKVEWVDDTRDEVEQPMTPVSEETTDQPPPINSQLSTQL